MASPTLIEQATIAAIAAMACPKKRVAAISRLARDNGTLPPVLSAMRREDLRTILAAWTGPIAALAPQVGITRSRISQLVPASLRLKEAPMSTRLDGQAA